MLLLKTIVERSFEGLQLNAAICLAMQSAATQQPEFRLYSVESNRFLTCYLAYYTYAGGSFEADTGAELRN